MTSGLPLAEKAHVDQAKIVDYLLNPAKSRGKAEFFLRFGFSPTRWREMADALKQHGRDGWLAAVVESAYGTRYSIDGPLATSDGRKPSVRSVWILERGTRPTETDHGTSDLRNTA